MKERGSATRVQQEPEAFRSSTKKRIDYSEIVYYGGKGKRIGLCHLLRILKEMDQLS